MTHRVPRRAWLLASAAALAGIFAAIIAVISEGPLRAVIGATAVVLLVTAFFCFGATSLESASGPPFDPDEPSPTPPVPQTQVTLVYNSGKTPDSTKNETYADSWYLMYSSVPDLNWARLRVFASGLAEVFDCDGTTTRFASREEATFWLAEDEFQALETFDAEDEEEYGVRFADVTPPQEQAEHELRSKMYVSARKK